MLFNAASHPSNYTEYLEFIQQQPAFRGNQSCGAGSGLWARLPPCTLFSFKSGLLRSNSRFSLQKSSRWAFSFSLQLSYWFSHKARIVHRFWCCTLTSFAYQPTLVFLFEDRLFQIKICSIFDLKLKLSYLQKKKQTKKKTLKKPNTGWFTFKDSFQDELSSCDKMFYTLVFDVTLSYLSTRKWSAGVGHFVWWHFLISDLVVTSRKKRRWVADKFCHFTFQVRERRNTSGPSGADF